MTDKASAWTRLPEEMRDRPQWALAGSDKAPLSVGSDGKLYNTSVTRPGEWLEFEDAVRWAEHFKDHVTSHVDKETGKTITQVGLDIGYILNEADPFTCIDLDVKDATTHPDKPHLWSTTEVFDEYERIYKTFDCYTERSKRGKGLHVWIGGKIGRGFKRNGIEVYSQERFIICTGNVLLNKPIRHHQDMLSNMVTQMRPVKKTIELEELPADVDDWHILQTAVNAANREKFVQLWTGKWEGEWSSQSEADLALLSMFTFYTESNDQCRRLFRDSALGKREKAVKNDRYIDLTLTTIRDRMARELRADVSALAESAKTTQELAAEILRMQGGVPPVQGVSTPLGLIEPRTEMSLHVPGTGDPVQTDVPPDVQMAQLAPETQAVVSAGEQGLAWPPGFTGAVAKFIYQSSPRPVKEVSIVAALGMLAGICGKAWHIPQSGLNLYIVLIARSAVGKEAMHSGISALIKSCSEVNPFFHRFMDFTEYASGPALIKACVGNPCFVNVSGEWGRKLKRLAQEDGRDGALQTLRTQMTNLYQKSGPQSIVGGIGYSSTDNNVASVAGVSYSMIGETTPGTFYEALTEGMMEDGFLSRFLMIEYSGDRPVGNKMAITAPDDALRDALAQLAETANSTIAQNHSHAVGRDEPSAYIMQAFEDECDGEINSTDDESRRQMWNRAALKAVRIAALLAVADNPYTPVIREVHINWAIDVVRRDINVMKRRMEQGDVGNGDNARERKMMTVIKDYMTNTVPDSYKIPDAMRLNSIVPRSYLQVRLSRVASYSSHKLGPARALDEALGNAIANGYLMEVVKDKVIEMYSHHGKAYRILKLPDYEAQARKR